MAAAKTATKTKTFLYDFTVDGGAVGAINTGIFLPASCNVLNVYFATLVGLTSGTSAATIEVGVSGGATFQAAAVITDFPGLNDAETVDNIIGLVAGPIATSHIVGTQIKVMGEVIMTIGVEPITAGKFYCTVEFEELYPVTAL